MQTLCFYFPTKFGNSTVATFVQRLSSHKSSDREFAVSVVLNAHDPVIIPVKPSTAIKHDCQ